MNNHFGKHGLVTLCRQITGMILTIQVSRSVYVQNINMSTLLVPAHSLPCDICIHNKWLAILTGLRTVIPILSHCYYVEAATNIYFEFDTRKSDFIDRNRLFLPY